MDDKKKRGTRRRKRKPTKEEIQRDKERRAKEKAEHELIEETVEHVSDKRYAHLRIAQIQENVMTMASNNRDLVRDMYVHWTHHELAQVQAAIDDPKISVLERMTAAKTVQGMKPETTNGLKASNYIEERISGKATQRVEHTGADGGPINVTNPVAKEREEAAKLVADMTAEEKKAYLKVLRAKQKVQDKVKNRLGINDESDSD